MKNLTTWCKQHLGIKPIHILTGILAVLLVLLFFYYTSALKKVKDANATIGQMLVNNKAFTVQHLIDSSTVYQQQQLIFTKQQIISKLRLDSEVTHLKNIHYAIKLKTMVDPGAFIIPSTLISDSSRVITFGGGFGEEHAVVDTTDWSKVFDYSIPEGGIADLSGGKVLSAYMNRPHAYLQLPDSFSIKNKWLAMNLSLDTLGVLRLDRGHVFNTQTIVIADKKMGFLRTPTPIVQITNANPMFQIQTIENGNVQYVQPFYKKPVVWLILGIVAGAYAGSKL